MSGVSVAAGAKRKGDVVPGDLRFGGGGGADSCRRLSLGVTGEISADRRSGRGRRDEPVGHELSRPIGGIGHSRGWQPGSKISTTIIRPPQQGQAFHASSLRPVSA